MTPTTTGSSSAQSRGSELIVREDKDLLRLGSFEGIGIVRPAEFPMRN
jgi:hypothetical protein